MDDALAMIEPLVAAAAADYEAQLGGRAACTVHRSGRVTGGITYFEGRLVALREALRIVERATADEIRPQLTALRDRWAEDLERRRTSRVNTPPWVAYATGGFDAAGEALASLPPDP